MPGGDITVVAGGWSVRNIELSHLAGQVIAVNDSALHLPRVDIVVSMDRLWTEHRWAWLLERAGPTWLRRSAVQNRDERWSGLTIFECDHKATQFVPAVAGDTYQLNGTNSGLCALNLAWWLRPARLFLLGFDFNRGLRGEAHWFPAYDWRPAGTSSRDYQQWAREISATREAFTAAGIEVFNVSPGSAVGGFKKITPAQYRVEFR